MTKDDLFRAYLDDPLLIEKNYIAAEQVPVIKYHQSSGIKLLEVIKIAVSGTIDGESDAIIVRKINQSLNKES